MDTYDPDAAPDPEAWLALDEGDRRALILAHHEGRFPDALHTEGSSEILHAALHGIVENQVASGSPAAAGRAVDRMTRDSLRRHAAVHAVMQVLAEHMGRLSGGQKFDHAAYERDLDRLTAGGALGSAMRAARQLSPGTGGNRAQRRAAARHSREGRKRRERTPSGNPPDKGRKE